MPIPNDRTIVEKLDRLEELYCLHRSEIRQYLIGLLKNRKRNDYSLESLQAMVAQTPYLMVAYVVNDECIQESPNIYKDHIKEDKRGLNRRPFLRYITTRRDNYFLSDPYYNDTSGKIYVLLYEEHEDKMLFSNFDIEAVIRALGYWS